MSRGFDLIFTITSRKEVYWDSLKIRLITVLNSKQSLRFCLTNNEKHSTPYITKYRHLVKTFSHNTGFDRCPHFSSTANYAPKNFIQFKAVFFLRPCLILEIYPDTLPP